MSEREIIPHRVRRGNSERMFYTIQDPNTLHSNKVIFLYRPESVTLKYAGKAVMFVGKGIGRMLAPDLGVSSENKSS